MKKKLFIRKLITRKNLAVGACVAVIFGLFFLNSLSFIYYLVVILVMLIFDWPYKIDGSKFYDGVFKTIRITDIYQLYVEESGRIVIYYTIPVEEKEYTKTVHPVDMEGFIATLKQVNEEITILRENS